MTGLSDLGFERKRLNDIKTDIEADLQESISPNIDLRPESVFGQLIGTFALPTAELWETSENVYLSQDPDFAEGVQLDAVSALTGTTRLPATNTTVQGVCFGVQGTIIPADSQARNPETQDIFITTSQATITNTSLLEAHIEVLTAVPLADYEVTVNGTLYTYTASTAPTISEILVGLQAAITNIAVDVTIENDLVVLRAEDLQTFFTVTLGDELDFAAIGSPVPFEAQEAGATVIPADSLTEIITPVAGWESVSNLTQGVTGDDRESDVDLRIRRRQSVSFPATATIDAIYSKLLATDDVDRVVVYQNNTDATDVNGVPRQHVWAIVQGGDPNDIGTVLYQNVAGGIGTFGDETVEVESLSGQLYEMNFSRPTEVEIYIDIEILTNGGYPPNGEDLIRAALIEWFRVNQGIGQKVKYSRLFTPINSVPGFEVTSLTIGITPAPVGTVSIDLDIDEIAIVREDLIMITEAP